MLTDLEIQYLHDFCEKKGIRYYDLKLEMVDHLATEIEKEKEHNALSTFGELLQIVFKRFGEKGFSSIVKQKEEYINQEYYRHHSSYVWSFFTPPRILLTIFIAVCLSLPFFGASREVTTQLSGIYLATMLLIGVITVVTIVVRFRKTTLPLLLLKGVKQKSLARNIGLILVATVNGLGILRKDLPSGYLQYIIAFTIISVTLFYSLIFLARYHAAQKMYSKAKKLYPFAFGL